MSGVSGLKLNSILSLLLVAMFVLGGFASLTSLETAANAQVGEDEDMNAVDSDAKPGSDRLANPDSVECQELLAKYGKSDDKVESTFKLWNSDHKALNVKEDASPTDARSESDRVDDSDGDRPDDQDDDRVDDQDRRDGQDVRDRIERLRQSIRDRMDRDRDGQREEIARHIMELRTSCAEGDREACGELREVLERLGDDDERRGDDRGDRRGHRHHHRGHWGDHGDRGDWGDRDHPDYRGGEEVSPRFTLPDDLDEERTAMLKQCLQFIVVDVQPPADCLNSDWNNADRIAPPEREWEWDETREREDPTRD